MNRQLDKLFSYDEAAFNDVYRYLTKLSNYYKESSQKKGVEYNVMIKQKIDTAILDDAISTYKTLVSDKEFKMLKIDS